MQLNHAELKPRAPQGLAAQQALRLQLVGAGLQVEVELVIEFALNPRTAGEVAQPLPQSARAHARRLPGLAPSTASIASTSCRHWRVSSLRRLRPAAVSA